jgi:hypothetical protein
MYLYIDAYSVGAGNYYGVPYTTPYKENGNSPSERVWTCRIIKRIFKV